MGRPLAQDLAALPRERREKIKRRAAELITEEMMLREVANAKRNNATKRQPPKDEKHRQSQAATADGGHARGSTNAGAKPHAATAGVDRTPTAWDNPTWVLAVMHYPADAQMRESYCSIRSAQLAKSIAPAILHRAADGMDESLGGAALQGHVAGMVLSLLYAMDTAPWGRGEVSLHKAIYLAGVCGRDMRRPGHAAPYGKTEIRASLEAMRPVAHLWAAWRLHQEWPTCEQRELLEPKGLKTLLGIARGVQHWALEWCPSRNPDTPPLLGEAPWLVSAEVSPLRPPWGKEAPAGLSEALEKYKRTK